MVGAKGPYRCIYGTAGRFKVTVTVQPLDGQGGGRTEVYGWRMKSSDNHLQVKRKEGRRTGRFAEVPQ